MGAWGGPQVVVGGMVSGRGKYIYIYIYIYIYVYIYTYNQIFNLVYKKHYKIFKIIFKIVSKINVLLTGRAIFVKRMSLHSENTIGLSTECTDLFNKRMLHI